MYFMKPQEEELLSVPLCTVLSNNHNFHLTGKWYDEKCSESGYGFICQKPQGKILSVSLSLFLFSVAVYLKLHLGVFSNMSVFLPLVFYNLSASQKQLCRVKVEFWLTGVSLPDSHIVCYCPTKKKRNINKTENTVLHAYNLTQQTQYI